MSEEETASTDKEIKKPNLADIAPSNKKMVEKTEFDAKMQELELIKQTLKESNETLTKMKQEKAKEELENVRGELSKYMDKEAMKKYDNASIETLKIVLETAQLVRGNAVPPKASVQQTEPSVKKGIIGSLTDKGWVI